MSKHQFLVDVEVDDDRLAEPGQAVADDPSEWTFADLVVAVNTGLATADVTDYTFDPE
jgi:hypothetical protein